MSPLRLASCEGVVQGIEQRIQSSAAAAEEASIRKAAVEATLEDAKLAIKVGFYEPIQTLPNIAFGPVAFGVPSPSLHPLTTTVTSALSCELLVFPGRHGARACDWGRVLDGG